MKLLSSISNAIRKGAELPEYGGLPGPTGRNITIGGWQPGGTYNYEAEAGDLWLNGVVMMNLRFKACAFSEVRPCVEVWSDADRKFVEANPTPDVRDYISRFLEPNDDYDWVTMLGSGALSDDVAGNAYFLKRPDNLGRYRAGYRFEPHLLMQADTADPRQLITHYWYGPPNGAQERVDKDQVVHLRQTILNPRERRLGLTPLAAVLRDICSDNELTGWQADILRNGAVPSHLLLPKAETDPNSWDTSRKTISELFKRYVKAMRGEVLTMPMPMEAVKLMWSPAELQISEQQLGPAARICSAQGTDMMVIGLPSPNKTYSNYGEAIDWVGKNTILPTLRRWGKQFGKQTLGDFNLDPNLYRLSFDTSDVSWLQDETDKIHDRVRKNFVANLIDLYTAQQELGMNPDDSTKGVFSWMLRPPPIAPVSATPAESKGYLDMIKRSAEARKQLGF